MTVKSDDEVFLHEKFAGLRNNITADSFALSDLESAFNVDIDDELSLLRRKGFSAPLVAGAMHSLWSDGEKCFVVLGTQLVQILHDFTTRVVRSGLTPGLTMAYESLAGRVYFSNGSENGAIAGGVARSWGLSVPPMSGAIPTGGALLPGKYQFAVVYVRSDGQQSGAGRAQVVDLPSGGGFRAMLTIPADPDVTEKRLYVSKPDGEILYSYGFYAASANEALVDSPVSWNLRLDTQHLSPPPAGEHLAYYNGRMYVARGNTLYPSEPYALELFDPRRAMPFTGALRMVAPVTDGIFVATDHETIFLAGKEPESFDYQVKADYGVIPGTLAYGSADQLGDGERDSRVAFWASTRGMCAGLDGGTLRNLTQNRFAYPTTSRGAGVVRRIRGINQYLAVLEGAETAGNAA